MGRATSRIADSTWEVAKCNRIPFFKCLRLTWVCGFGTLADFSWDVATRVQIPACLRLHASSDKLAGICCTPRLAVSPDRLAQSAEQRHCCSCQRLSITHQAPLNLPGAHLSGALKQLRATTAPIRVLSGSACRLWPVSCCVQPLTRLIAACVLCPARSDEPVLWYLPKLILPLLCHLRPARTWAVRLAIWTSCRHSLPERFLGFLAWASALGLTLFNGCLQPAAASLLCQARSQVTKQADVMGELDSGLVDGKADLYIPAGVMLSELITWTPPDLQTWMSCWASVCLQPVCGSVKAPEVLQGIGSRYG